MKRQTQISALYSKYGPTIYARCNRLLKNAAAAEDATQDVFVKLLKHFEAAPSEGAMLPWIYRVATNHCFNVIRDAKRHAEPTERTSELEGEPFEEEVLARDFSDRLWASMPEELRRPAQLYHGRGIEQAQVAQALGVSRRTVLYRLAEFTRRAMRMQQLVEQS